MKTSEQGHWRALYSHRGIRQKTEVTEHQHAIRLGSDLDLMDTQLCLFPSTVPRELDLRDKDYVKKTCLDGKSWLESL